jgi:hypothetical protein
MMKIYMFIGIAAGVFAAGMSGNAVAQNLMPGLLGCKNIDDDSDRLACFDGLVSGFDSPAAVAAASNAEAAAPSESQTVAPEPVLTAVEGFGAGDLAATQEKAREKRKKIKSLTASVIDVARNKRGQYIVILDNGQIWRQIRADTNKLRVPSAGAEGMSVVIKRKSLGAHALYLNGENRSIRVERIK